MRSSCFGENRDAALEKQKLAGREDGRCRGAVTGGQKHGRLRHVGPRSDKSATGLRMRRSCCKEVFSRFPGFFRPTKLWDVLIPDEKRLVAALVIQVSGWTLFRKQHEQPSRGGYRHPADSLDRLSRGCLWQGGGQTIWWAGLCCSKTRRNPRCPIRRQLTALSGISRIQERCPTRNGTRFCSESSFRSSFTHLLASFSRRRRHARQATTRVRAN